jgi:hypothetical protein
MNETGMYNEVLSSFNHTNNLKIANFDSLHLGKIKDNKDVLKLGRVRVYITSSNTNESDSDSWVTCVWSSPIAGSTKEYDIGNSVSFDDTQKSYGWWGIPPDLDNYVVVAFPKGMETGVVLGCLYQIDVNHSIPGLAYSEESGNNPKPCAEKNRKVQKPNDTNLADHTPFLSHLKTQGLDEDKYRGATSSSARRESPSHVYGFLSPRQHQLVIDDGKPVEDNNYVTPREDSQIRLRTQNGMQVLMHAEKNILYINNADGSCWLEMTPEGNLHVYSKKNISFNAEENINFHASKNVNIEAKQEMVIRAGTKMIVETGNDNLNIFSGKELLLYATSQGHIKCEGNLKQTAPRIDLNGPPATKAEEKKLQPLSSNVKVTQAIVTEAPEHEPWKGHSVK